MNEPPTAASVLLRLRIGAGLSQERLAYRSEISVRTIRGLENGSIRTPRRATLLALAQPLALHGNDLATFLHTWQAGEHEALTFAELTSHQALLTGEFIAAIDNQPLRLRDIIKIADVLIDQDGRLATITMTRTFEALDSGLDRVLWCQDLPPDLTHPDAITVTGLTNCRAGRTVTLSPTVLAHEVLLAGPVAHGDRFMISFTCDFRGSFHHNGLPPTGEIESLTGTAVGVAVQIETVRFTPPRLPAQIWQVGQRAVSDQSPPIRMLTLNSHNTAQIVVERPHPGAHGLRWTWNEATPPLPQPR